MKFYRDSNNLYTLSGLKNLQTGAYINNAAVTMAIKLRSDNSTIVAATNMAYVAASSGVYQVNLPPTAPPLGELYYAEIVAIDTNSNKVTFRPKVIVTDKE